LGNWTKKLHRLATEREGQPCPRILVEGPFGSPGVDLDSDRYKCILAISGGIGITPMQSITNDLLEQHCRGRPLKLISFIWSVRDRAMLGALNAGEQQQQTIQQGLANPDDVLLQEREPAPAARAEPGVPRLPISFQPDLLISHKLSLGSHLSDASDASEDAFRPKASTFDEEGGDGSAKDPTAAASSLLQSEFFLTKVRRKEDFESAGIAVEEQKCLRFGRPDLPAAFERMRRVAAEAGETRVAVLVCGPEGMVKQVRQLCRQFSSSKSKGSVAFDYHCEEFAF